VRTLTRVHAILEAARPTGDVRVLVGPGVYACREMAAPWTFRGARTITVEPRGVVPSPARLSATHPQRPVFVGRREGGTLCGSSVWLSIAHGRAAVRLTLRGLAVRGYRGGVTLRDDEPPVTVPQQVTLDNMVFEEIGDLHHRVVRGDGSVLDGKGAVLLGNTRGNRIANSLFRDVRNGPNGPGLVHGIYFTSLASDNLVEDNAFETCSGAWIKLTDFSNGNVFRGNRFAAAPAALVDRWCGAREPASACADGVVDCPSWENTFDLGRNDTAGIAGEAVVVYRVPVGQVCRWRPPSSGVRLRLGPTRVVTDAWP
jgi:hypothetical protein